MTRGRRGSASEAATGEVVGEAGLTVTFHFPRKEESVQSLQNHLCESLGLEPDPKRTLTWRRLEPAGEEAFLQRFDPAHDATTLQLALNAPGDAAGAWEALRREVEDLLNGQEPEAQVRDGFWGYTLTYHGELNHGIDADEAFGEVRSAARSLHPDSKEGNMLAQAKMMGGWIWLLTVPTQGSGLAAATVYVALSTSENARAFVKAFYGKHAELFMPDLIAHKGYYEKHQYRGKNRDAYKRDLEQFRTTTKRWLNDLAQQKQPEPEKLDDLIRDYNELVKRVWDLENLRVSMVQQLHNYDRWSATRDNAVLEYHRRDMETTNLELELLVTEGRYALGVANPVLSMAQLQRDKAKEDEQRRINEEQESRRLTIQWMLAVVAAALTVPGLMDQRATAAFAALFGIQMNPGDNGDLLFILVLQIGMIVVVALFLKFAFIDRLVRKPSGRSSKREQ